MASPRRRRNKFKPEPDPFGEMPVFKWMGFERLWPLYDKSPFGIVEIDGKQEYHLHCETFEPDVIMPRKTCCLAPVLQKWGRRKVMYRDRRIEPMPTWLTIHKRRFRCKTCQTMVLESIPEVNDKHLVTERLAEGIAMSAIKRTFDDAATFHAVEETLVSRIFNSFADEKLKQYQPHMPRVFGVDENYILGGNRFMCLDIEAGTLLDILPERNEKQLRAYFDDIYTLHHVEVFVQDMWRGYRTIAKRHFPKAINVIDKFHVVRYANFAFDEARRKYQNSLNRDDKIGMKRTNRLFLARWDNLQDESQDKLAGILQEHPFLNDAYVWKERFYHLYDADTRGNAEAEFARWRDDMPRELRRFFAPLLTAMGNWHEQVFNYFEAPYTNGLVENMNGRINKINSLAHGLKFDTLRKKALLRYGDIVPMSRFFAFNVRLPDLMEMEARGEVPPFAIPVGQGVPLSTLAKALKRPWI